MEKHPQTITCRSYFTAFFLSFGVRVCPQFWQQLLIKLTLLSHLGHDSDISNGLAVEGVVRPGCRGDTERATVAGMGDFSPVCVSGTRMLPEQEGQSMVCPVISGGASKDWLQCGQLNFKSLIFSPSRVSLTRLLWLFYLIYSVSVAWPKREGAQTHSDWVPPSTLLRM